MSEDKKRHLSKDGKRELIIIDGGPPYYEPILTYDVPTEPYKSKPFDWMAWEEGRLSDGN